MKMIRGIPSAISADLSWRIAIIHSSYYKEEMAPLRESAREGLLEAGIPPKNIIECEAAGSFEIPLLGAVLASQKKVDALIGLGIIIEGETHHAKLLACEVARGIMDVQLRFQTPFAFEVLYVKNLRQARARFARGAEAARVVLHSLAQLKSLRS
ncbi:6,7-dimethyl-8-ribityllumazine synthase [Candidatus Peregrinibacteria bacterium]|nr:6,7-dimethyl-8-ribityllumazine synthase [Candidatus Peregrinibacteria bacterium]MBI3815989.1 6,7-dimethyl-8-ribityllumazine synthase [Candidatus Peregrinibacteria bacterium]